MKLSYAFATGMVATLNPCGFVLLPTYLMYFLGVSNSPGGQRRASIGRALSVSAAVSGGFMVVFVIAGAISRFFSSWILDNAKYATALIAVVFIGLGVAMLFGYHLPITTPKLDAGGRDRTVVSMFVYGVAYAVASIGCTLPLFTSAIVFGAAKLEGNLAGIGNGLAYGLGMALVITALTVALAAANNRLLSWMRSAMQYVEMVGGAFVLLAGIYLLYYFWQVDVRGRTNPVTSAVLDRSATLQALLQEHWRLVSAVFVVVVTAAIVAATRARRTTRQSRQPSTHVGT